MPPTCPEFHPTQCPEKPATEAPTVKIIQPVFVATNRLIANTYERRAFRMHARDEHETYGQSQSIKGYKKKKYGKSIVEQRSGRKRLLDHNIFLRALFQGRLKSEAFGDLKAQFEGALFFDIGSAILFGDGADTVRDLYEDITITEHLQFIASDINDPAQKKTMYIKIFRASGKKLPFPLVEIPQLMNRPEHFINPPAAYLKPEQSVILRSCNAGPDLYYTQAQVDAHLKAAAEAFQNRPLIYFFNKFIFYKPARYKNFVILGEIDPEVGVNHRETPWKTIDWARRSFTQAIELNPQYIKYQ